MATKDLYAKAREAVERANYDYAVELFRQVLRQDPEYQDARKVLRGTERRRLQEKGRSIVGLVGLPFAMAWTFFSGLTGGARKKLEAYEDFLEKHPDSFWGLCGAARAAEKAGLTNEAVDIYRDALNHKPQNKKALRRLADLLIDQGDTAEALKYLKRLRDLQPEDRELLHEVRDLEATGHMAAHKMEAGQSFRELIRDREQAEQFEEERRMAVSMGDLKGQVSRLERQLEEEPENVNRILRLARLYRDADRLGDARDLLREKRELMPENYEIREELGDLQLVIYDQAIAAAEESDEPDAEARAEELREKRNQYGIKEYEWRLAEHPTDREARLQLGRFYMENGGFNDAIAAFQEAAEDGRLETSARKLLGLCFMRKKQNDLAVEQFEQALSLHPEMDDEGKGLRYLMAQAKEAMGQREEALQIYKRIYSQDINFRDVSEKVDALTP